MSKRGQELLVNVLESPVRHHHDEVAGSRFASNRRNDVVDLWNEARVLPCRLQVGDHLFHIELLVLREDRPKDAWKHDPVRVCECADEVGLKIRRQAVADRGSKIAQIRRSG